MIPKSDIQIVAGPDELLAAAEVEFLRAASAAIKDKGKFTVALSGGETPKTLYASLAQRVGFRWDKTHFFWTDERCVPPTSPQSNYRMAHEAMLSQVPMPVGNIHRMKAENPNPQEAADAYADELRDFFGGQLPRFDLMLLGMGPDGHTASLFPGTDAVNERDRWVAAPWVEKFNSFRVTLTVPVINNSACIVFLARGEEKAETLRAVLEDDGPPRFPSQLIRPTSGRLLWLVDQGAAKVLRK